MAYKDEQKDLKQPDDFQKFGQQEAVPFLEKHGRQLVVAIGGVLLVGFVLAIVSSLGNKNEAEAAREFGTALKILDRPVNANGPATPPKAGEEPPFKSEAEKDEAIVKVLGDFRAKYPNRKPTVAAALPLAQVYLRQGKAEQALALVDEFLAKAEPNDALRPAAIETRGYALEAQKKLDDAMTAFDQLAKLNRTDFMKGMGEYHRARILMLKGDMTAAAKALVDLESSAPNTAAARLAKDRIAVLSAQGVEIPSTANKEMPPLHVTPEAGK